MTRSSIAKLVAISLLPVLIGVSGGEPSTASFKLARQSGPFAEPVTGWMVENTLEKLRPGRSPAAGPQEVRDHFAAEALGLNGTGGSGDAGRYGPARTAAPPAPEPPAGRESVESAIERAIARAAADGGVGRIALPFQGVFPPVVFRFEELPKLVVTSPRSRIEREASVLLRPDLTSAEVAEIEAKASDGSTSSLVTTIGGLGTYPSMVPLGAGSRRTFRTVAHEWAHQLLAFTPMGWRYALGGERDGRMITLNETVAEIVGTELGDRAYGEFYPDSTAEQQTPKVDEEKFKRMMRGIRTQVDAMLAAGRVEAAEEFMESSRQGLEREGFRIRKLNQAYFAFYGSYADDPSSAGQAGGEISARLHRLREASRDLGGFVTRVSAAGSYEEFLRLTDPGQTPQ